MSLRRRASLLVFLVSALLLPTAARAQKVVTSDPAADAVSISSDATGSDDVGLAPEETRADLLRTTVAHTASRVQVVTTTREVGRGPDYLVMLRVRTPDGTFSAAAYGLGGRGPAVRLVRGNRVVDCPRSHASSDESAARVVIAIPSSCLGAPRWIRVGIGVSRYVSLDGTSNDEHWVMYVDDAHRAGDVGDDLALGPKIRRG